MSKPFEWMIGMRYTRAGKRAGRNSFISFISAISLAGIALGVAAVIIVLSIMNGFQKDVTGRMLSVLAHIEIFDKSQAMPDMMNESEEQKAGRAHGQKDESDVQQEQRQP